MSPSFDVSRYQNPTTIQRVLFAAKTVAIVGLSKKELRASYFVGFYLRRHGYRIIPVNPRESAILGEPSYSSLSDVPDAVDIDIVNVFRAPDALPGIAKEAVAVGAKTLWCQFTVESTRRVGKSPKTAVSRLSWIGVSRSNTRGTWDGCTGWASIPSASRQCAVAFSSRRPGRAK